MEIGTQKKEIFLSRYCQERIDGNDICEVDHIIPQSEGGKNHINNLQLLHKECHQAKTKT